MEAREATAKALDTARKQSGLTQKQLGENAGMSQQTAGEYMRGERNPTVMTFIKLCEAMSAEPAEIMREITNLMEEKEMKKNRIPEPWQQLGYLPPDVMDIRGLEATIKHLRSMFDGSFKRAMPMDSWEVEHMLRCEEELARRNARS